MVLLLLAAMAGIPVARLSGASTKQVMPLPSKSDTNSSVRIEYNGAILVCDEPVRDVATLWIGPPVRHEFTIRNEGTSAGWFRLVHAVAGTKPRCVVRIEPGETTYDPFNVRSDKLRGTFEKSAIIRMVPDPGDACVHCLRSYESKQHSLTCEPECVEPQDTSYCFRRPFENACEAMP